MTTKRSAVVSIVTSTYNRAEVVRAAIESVRAQTFADWEMNIVGDCTPDHTAEVVASYNDPRLQFYNLPEKSPPRAHGAIAKNHAIREMSSGRYIAYLDDDDRYRPGYLGTMIGYLNAHPETRFVYCRCMYRDKKTGRRIWGNPFQRWMHGYSLEKLERYNFIDTDCVVHDKALLDEVGYWDPDYYFDDYELFLRIARKYDLHYINKVLVEKYVDEPAFLARALRKGWQILRHGRSTPLE
ncbi:MAG: glycosyltransferase [Kiritimatiellae bacterium]|nr:glycosyltransferase [Kiritimatiellia bacterium]